MPQVSNSSRPLAGLEERLLRALREGDGPAIAAAYLEASVAAAENGEEPRSAFLLTQAWIHALEAGDPVAETCRKRLEALGRV